VRYHGVLACNANARPEVVPGREPVADEQLPLFSDRVVARGVV